MRLIFFGRRSEDGPKTLSSRLLALGIRLGIYAAALWLAAEVVPGIEIEGWRALVGAALIFGVVNAVVRPVAHILGCPLTCLTLGLFALVINAAMLALTAWIAGQFDLAVHIDGFWAAFWGALLISVVGGLLIALVERPIVRAFTPDPPREGTE